MPDYIQILLRAIFAYFILLFLTKAMGKRQISQLTFFDYVVGITIGSITAMLSTSINISFYAILPAVFAFAILQLIISYLSLKNKSLRNFFQGTKTVLIEKGIINEDNMRKERINIDELQSKLRDKNAFKLADVEFAYLETDGKISVMKKATKQPVTPNDMNIQVKNTGVGHLVIEEGKFVDNAIRKSGVTKAYLKSKLSKAGIENIEKVLFAQIDDSGEIYIDVYDEYQNNLNVTKTNNLEQVLMNAKVLEADLKTLALDANDSNTTQIYNDLSQNMNNLVKALESTQQNSI